MAVIKIVSMIFQRLPIIGRKSVLTSEHFCLSRTLEFISNCSTTATADPPGVQQIKKLLKEKFPLAKRIEVIDMSGGCGEMYNIFVESVEFKGLTLVKQHRIINETLKEKLKEMHGLKIQTAIPPEKVS